MNTERLPLAGGAAGEAEALVLECMALQPHLQALTELDMLQATHGVITNARPDHLDVMGPDARAVAHALAGTTPLAGRLYTCEEQHRDVLVAAARDRGAEVSRDDKHRAHVDVGGEKGARVRPRDCEWEQHDHERATEPLPGDFPRAGDCKDDAKVQGEFGGLRLGEGLELLLASVGGEEEAGQGGDRHGGGQADAGGQAGVDRPAAEVEHHVHRQADDRGQGHAPGRRQALAGADAVEHGGEAGDQQAEDKRGERQAGQARILDYADRQAPRIVGDGYRLGGGLAVVEIAIEGGGQQGAVAAIVVVQAHAVFEGEAFTGDDAVALVHP